MVGAMTIEEAARVYIRRGRHTATFASDPYGVKRTIRPGDTLVLEALDGRRQDAIVRPPSSPAMLGWELWLTSQEYYPRG